MSTIALIERKRRTEVGCSSSLTLKLLPKPRMIRHHDEKLHSTKNHFDNMKSRKKSTDAIGFHGTAAALRNDIDSRRVTIKSMQARISILHGAEEMLPHLIWGSEATVSLGEG